ncbi:sulfatase-like hydrolase/transferase, partial [bacterium]|nr:sulfatase-like hydrolase/transferase [bacterium]
MKLISSILTVAILVAQADRKPNIVFILADDLGYGELGCYGQKKIRTPNIDQLASQGIKFTHHYTGAPVCAPARCVLLTGLHLGHAEIRNNGDSKNGREFPG